MSTPVKQVIAIRRDLKMRRGKECAQASHASMEWLRQILMDPGYFELFGDILSHDQWEWLEGDRTKVVVQLADEAELLALEAAADAASLIVNVVTDLGRTEFGGVSTRTCIAIGPNLADQIDAVCGHLKLY